MNSNSYICSFISRHPVDWEEILVKEYCVKVKKEGNYAIFNYSFNCRFDEPVVQEARGIIIDTARLEVVCWPFRKFGNHNESYADTIDWSSARVLEKVDGSIVKLWYDTALGKWQFSTNGTIRAEKAPIEGYGGLHFGDVILRADNYGDIPFDRLNKEYTYIFELVSPETQVVVKYDTASLYHTGTRSNVTGVEYEVDIGIKKPASYGLGSLQQCLQAAAALNKDAEGDEIAKEGFVVVDGNWNRVKVKSPDYLYMHRLMQGFSITKRECLELIINGDASIKDICSTNPSLIPMFKYYDYWLAELKHQADKLGVLAKGLYKEYSGDRSAVAKIILGHKLSKVGFRCINSDKSGSEILMDFPLGGLANLIPDYQPDELHSLFLGEDSSSK